MQPAVPRRMTVDARRAALLETGLALFARRPVDEVPVEDVARAAGVSAGLLYHYFGSKRDYHRAVVAEVYDRLRAATEPDPALPPEERLRASLARFLDFVEENASGWAWLLRGSAGRDPELVALGERLTDVTVERVLTGLALPGPDPLAELAVRGWVGFLNESALAWSRERTVARDDLLALQVEALRGALVPCGISFPAELGPPPRR